jgi:hypothetical protein
VQHARANRERTWIVLPKPFRSTLRGGAHRRGDLDVAE